MPLFFESVKNINQMLRNFKVVAVWRTSVRIGCKRTGSRSIEKAIQVQINGGKSIPLRRDKGFTLIELIVVLVIMGIIAGVAVPRYTGSFDSIRFRKTMSEVVSFLREARIGAMASAGTKHVTFDLHRGFCWNDDKKVLKLPGKIEMFTDKIEARDDQTKIITFYPNGMALAEKIGFVCDDMVAVVHVEPLGGLAYYKINEEMEQVIRYVRVDDERSDEDIEKDIDKLIDSDTLTKNELTDEPGVDYEFDDEDYEDGDSETEIFDEDDEDMDDE